jgi:hypothetical protein
MLWVTPVRRALLLSWLFAAFAPSSHAAESGLISCCRFLNGVTAWPRYPRHGLAMPAENSRGIDQVLASFADEATR